MPLVIFAKRSILDVRQGSEYASEFCFIILKTILPLISINDVKHIYKLP